jgi:hypothetical protein
MEKKLQPVNAPSDGPRFDSTLPARNDVKDQCALDNQTKREVETL